MRYRGCTLLLTAVLVAGCASASRPSGAAPVRTSAPSPRPPADVADLRLVGVNGAAAWQLTSTTLTISDDAGAHWSTVPLPAGVAPKAVGTVTAAPGRGVWLGVPDGDAFDVYHRATAGWTRSRLVPTKPASLSVGGAPPTGAITLGPARLVSTVIGWGLGMSSAYDRLFVSTDGGASFRQRPAPGGMHITAVVFFDAEHALATEGPTGANRFAFRTADGGATWRPVPLPFGTGDSFELDSATTDGRAFLLPVLVDGTSDSQVDVLRSTDFGATFTRTSAPLDIPDADSAGDPQLGEDGATIWVPARGRIYETTDAGAHWTTVPTTVSPDPIGPAGGARAIGVVTDSGCRQFKSDCFYDTYLAATSDGGRTWRTVG